MSAFMAHFGGEETPIEARRYLFAPLQGSVEDFEQNPELTLTPEKMDFFNEDNGFEQWHADRVETLNLGESICIFDGIGQVSSILRVR
jgi:hypothetical protein